MPQRNLGKAKEERKMVRDPYEDYGQAYDREFEERLKRKKAKEREKRIKEMKARRKEDFDIDTEEVIKMTNKKNISCFGNCANNRNDSRWSCFCHDFANF